MGSRSQSLIESPASRFYFLPLSFGGNYSSVEHRNLQKKNLAGDFPAVSGVEAKVRRGRGGRGGLARPDLLDRARARGTVSSAGEAACSVACSLPSLRAGSSGAALLRRDDSCCVEVLEQCLRASSRENAGRARQRRGVLRSSAVLAGPGVAAAALAGDAALASASERLRSLMASLAFSCSHAHLCMRAAYRRDRAAKLRTMHACTVARS